MTDYGRRRDEAREREHIQSMRRHYRIPESGVVVQVPYCRCAHPHGDHWGYSEREGVQALINLYTGGACKTCSAPPCEKFRFLKLYGRVQ